MSQEAWQPLEEQLQRVERTIAELDRDRRQLLARVEALQRERGELAGRIRALLQRLREVDVDE